MLYLEESNSKEKSLCYRMSRHISFCFSVAFRFNCKIDTIISFELCILGDGNIENLVTLHPPDCQSVYYRDVSLIPCTISLSLFLFICKILLFYISAFSQF